MLCVVVVARRKSFQTVCQPVDGRIIGGVIVVWEYDVEAAIELGSSKLAKVLVGERQTDEVGLRAL